MSELRANTISAANGTGPVTLTKQSAAKAWASYQTYTSAQINDSINISTLTDHSTGSHTLSFTNNLIAGQYSSSYASTATLVGTNDEGRTVTAATSSPAASIKMRIIATSTETNYDSNGNNYTAHGDLA